MSAYFSEYAVPKGGGMLYTLSESHRKGLFKDVGLGGGGKGSYVREFWPLLWTILFFLPHSGPVADWLHSIAGVSTAMLWRVNWCQFFWGFFWVYRAHLGQMHQCEGTNSLVEPFYLAFHGHFLPLATPRGIGVVCRIVVEASMGICGEARGPAWHKIYNGHSGGCVSSAQPALVLAMRATPLRPHRLLLG